MKTTVSAYDFERAFADMGRKDQFSYEGLKALYEWFEQYEEDTGEEIELDVIGICCDFSEYDSALEAAEEYGWIKYDDLSDEENEPEAIEWLQDRTTVIVVDAVQYLGDRSFSGSVIIQGF